jgi:hypothetical protein
MAPAVMLAAGRARSFRACRQRGHEQLPPHRPAARAPPRAGALPAERHAPVRSGRAGWPLGRVPDRRVTRRAGPLNRTPRPATGRAGPSRVAARRRVCCSGSGARFAPVPASRSDAGQDAPRPLPWSLLGPRGCAPNAHPCCCVPSALYGNICSMTKVGDRPQSTDELSEALFSVGEAKRQLLPPTSHIT